MCTQHWETFPATLPLPSARHVSSRLLNAPPGHSPASSPPSPQGPQTTIRAPSLPCWELSHPPVLPLLPSYLGFPWCLPNPRPLLPLPPLPWNEPSSLLVWVTATASQFRFLWLSLVPSLSPSLPRLFPFLLSVPCIPKVQPKSSLLPDLMN